MTSKLLPLNPGSDGFAVNQSDCSSFNQLFFCSPKISWAARDSGSNFELDKKENNEVLDLKELI